MTTATIVRPAVDDRFLCDLFDGVAGSYAVGIAHDLGIFRLLHEEPRTAEELCAALAIDCRHPESLAVGGCRPALSGVEGLAEERARAGRAGPPTANRQPPTARDDTTRRLEILLNLCVAAKLVGVADERYALTETAETYLVETSPTYAGALFELWSGDDPPFSFKKLREGMLRDPRHAAGQRPWIDHHRDDGDAARSFTRIMHGHSMAPALAWPDHIDFAHHRCMLDVGGGSGAHAIAAGMRWPRLKAIVLDLPSVCAVADEYIARYGLRDRVRAHAADMWRDPYPDADVHFYSDVFHNWTPEECASLARKSFASLPESGCIILHEMLYDDDKRGPFTVAGSSMAMLAWCGGQQFSGPELVDLLRDAGFHDTRVTPTFGYWSVVVGTKR